MQSVRRVLQVARAFGRNDSLFAQFGIVEERNLSYVVRRHPSKSIRNVSKQDMDTNTQKYQHRFIDCKDQNALRAEADHASTSGRPLSCRFISYNLLAQVYIKRSVFEYVKVPQVLKWKMRSQALADELLSFDADVLCLQEVDKFDSFYLPLMSRSGYSSIYVKRPGTKKDGCCIFYRPSRLNLISEAVVNYNDLAPPPTSTSPEDTPVDNTKSDGKEKERFRGDPKDPSFRLKRDCVGVLAAFRRKGVTGPPFIVACTHLYWDPNWADVKLAQARHFLHSLHAFREKIKKDEESRIPIIVCGDFNSMPGDTVHKYLRSGLPQNQGGSQEPVLGTDSLLGDKDLRASDAESSGSVAPIALESVYVAGETEMELTTYTGKFTGTIDYIMHSVDSGVEVVRLLRVPGKEDVSSIDRFPNIHHPSDHLPLGVDIVFND